MRIYTFQMNIRLDSFEKNPKILQKVMDKVGAFKISESPIMGHVNLHFYGHESPGGMYPDEADKKIQQFESELAEWSPIFS